MKRFNYPEYVRLREIFTNNTRTGNYFLHFNFRLANNEIPPYPKTNVSRSIFGYVDRLQKMGLYTCETILILIFPTPERITRIS